MLNAYLARTNQLLQNPAATNALYSPVDLTAYINSARGQLAGETECVRANGSLPLTYNTISYGFASIVPGVAGTAGVFNVRGTTIGIAEGQVWLAPRPFPYFQLYYLNNPVPNLGQPHSYSQFGQGETGTLYFWPVPDYGYTASVDVICVPAPLVDDSSPECIPYPYTDAVPYYAAYLALSSAQRFQDADRMWQQYQTFATRARKISNGPVLPQQYPQSPNPVRANQIGMTGSAQ